MGGLKKVPSEGGAGGKKGHSNMEHWAYTEEIKTAARRKRRQEDDSSIQEQLKDTEDSADK